MHAVPLPPINAETKGTYRKLAKQGFVLRLAHKGKTQLLFSNANTDKLLPLYLYLWKFRTANQADRLDDT